MPKSIEVGHQFPPLRLELKNLLFLGLKPAGFQNGATALALLGLEFADSRSEDLFASRLHQPIPYTKSLCLLSVSHSVCVYPIGSSYTKPSVILAIQPHSHRL